jgi:hypothetical protein
MTDIIPPIVQQIIPELTKAEKQIEAAVAMVASMPAVGDAVKRILVAFSAGGSPPPKPFMGEHFLSTATQVEYTFKGAWVAPKAPPVLKLIGL